MNAGTMGIAMAARPVEGNDYRTYGQCVPAGFSLSQGIHVLAAQVALLAFGVYLLMR